MGRTILWYSVLLLAGNHFTRRPWMGESVHGAVSPMNTTPRKAGVLSQVGLDRPELRAWAMYDWAVSSVQTTIMVAGR